MTSCVLAFNGERLDPVSETYHLGNGYRAYSPVLMRFTCPDSWSPFGAGGINAYAYCAGDPVNRSDPTGHMSWQAGLGIGLGILGILGAVFTGGASIAAAGSISAALAGASTVSLVVGTAALVADVTGIASAATEESNPKASAALGWTSLAFGILSLGAGLAGRVVRRGTKTVAAASRNVDGYAPEQVAAWDRVATRGFRHGGLPGGAPTDYSRVINVEAGTYKTVSDNVTQLNAIGLYQCTAVGVEYNNQRTLMHFYQSNLRYGLKEAEQTASVANQTGTSVMTEFVEYLSNLKNNSSLRNVKVKVMSGLFAQIPPFEFITGNEPMMHLLDIAGVRRFKVYKGSSLIMLGRGGFETGDAEKIRFNIS